LSSAIKESLEDNDRYAITFKRAFGRTSAPSLYHYRDGPIETAENMDEVVFGLSFPAVSGLSLITEVAGCRFHHVCGMMHFRSKWQEVGR